MYAALDGLAAGATLDTAAAAGAHAGERAVPELFRSVGAGALLDVAKAEVKQIESTADKAVAVVKTPVAPGAADALLNRALALARKQTPELARQADALVEWWTRPRAHRAAERCLPHRELDVLVISSMILFLWKSFGLLTFN
jgi:hypothetical protein